MVFFFNSPVFSPKAQAEWPLLRVSDPGGWRSARTVAVSQTLGFFKGSPNFSTPTNVTRRPDPFHFIAELTVYIRHFLIFLPHL